MAVATLSVDIEARLAKLEAGMTQATRVAEKNAAAMASKYDKLNDTFTKLGKGFAGVFSAKMLVDFAASTFQAMDQLNDFADAVGTSVENASALEDAARRTGTGMDVVTDAAVKMNQVLKEADAGSVAAQALKAIGLNAEELRRMDPAEALLQIAQALSNFADDGYKARLIMELFGKSAARVAPFLKDLAEQQRLVGTMTKAQLEEVDKLNREWANMTKNVDDLARAIGGPLITALNKLFQAFRAIREKGFFAALGDDIALGIATRKVEANAKLMAEVNNPANYGNEGRRQRVLPSVLDVSGLKDEKDKKSKKSADAKIEFPDSLQSMLDRINASDEQKLMRLRDTLEEMRRFVEGGGTLPDSVFASIAEDIAKLDPEAQKAAAAAKELTRAMEEGKQIFQATRTPAELLQQQIEKLNELLQQGAIDWDTYARATFEAQDAFDKATAKTADKAKEVDDVARELGLTFSSAFEDAIVEGENLRGVLQGLENDILRIVARKLVTEPLGNAVTGLLGGGGIGDIFGKIGSLFAGGFAEGGFIPPGQWGIVGERGPELAFGGRSGKTISAGMQVTNVFHLAGPADARTQQQIAAAAARGVAQASRRGN